MRAVWIHKMQGRDTRGCCYWL